MRKIISILINHKWAILLALISAIIIVYPQLYFRYDNSQSYQGFDMMHTADEDAYLGMIQEVQDGYFWSGNPYLKEGKKDPYTIQPLGPIIVGLLGKLFLLDLNNTVLLSRFLFPTLCFLVIYWFTFLLSKDELTALTSSTMVILGSILLSRQVFQVLTGESPRLDFLIFTRLINPPVSSLFFFGFLIFFWLFLERKKWIWGVFSALTLGLSFYLYFYTWTFLYAFCGVFMLILLFQKKWSEIKRIMLVPLGGILIAIPYFWNLYQSSTYPTFLEVARRNGLLETHTPTFGFLIPFLLIIFLIFFPRQWKERYFFSLALVLAPFVVLNQQIITGKTLINAHYHWYCHTPLAIIFFLIIFFYWLSQKKLETFKKLFALLIIGMSIYAGVLIQKASYLYWEKQALEEQRYMLVFDWLNKNAKKEEVVFADLELSNFIPVYTSLNVFYNSTAKYYLSASEERLINTMILLYRLDEVEKDDAEEVFFRERAKISREIYGIYYRETTGEYEGIPEELLHSFTQKYKKSFSIPTDEFLKEIWKEYNVNYVVWDSKYYPKWSLEKAFLQKVYEKEDIKIYKIL